jgi:hypothetical protein
MIGGSTSPLEAHAAWLLNLIAKRPDLTLDEIVEAMPTCDVLDHQDHDADQQGRRS